MGLKVNKKGTVSGSVNYAKVKQHLRQLWIVFKCVYR